jgi:hypothetical protein
MSTPDNLGHATFAIKSWEEQAYEEFDGGRKLTRANVAYTFQGDIEVESTLIYLMSYGAQGAGVYVGLERVTGRVVGRSGSFVIHHTGSFETHGVKDTWFIAPDSGTGELQGLRGKGEFSISGHGPYPITFEYSFE